MMHLLITLIAVMAVHGCGGQTNLLNPISIKSPQAIRKKKEKKDTCKEDDSKNASHI